MYITYEDYAGIYGEAAITIGLFTVDDSGEITFVPDTEDDTEPAAVGA